MKDFSLFFRGVLYLRAGRYSKWMANAVNFIDDDFEIKIIPGMECQTLDEMYDCIAKNFSFPDYFGRNPNALMDCMRDIAPITKKNFIIKIENAFNFLVKEPAEDLSEIIYFFDCISEEWSHGSQQGLPNDYDPKNLLIVFVYDEV